MSRPMLKKCLAECGLRQADVVRMTGFSAATICLTLKGHPLPQRFEEVLSNTLLKDQRVESWMFERRMTLKALLEAEKEQMADKTEETEENKEVKVEMLNMNVMRHFGLTRNPFANDVQSEKDIFISADHSFVKEAMLDAARNGNMIAVYGEVGSGKSTIRKAVMKELKAEGIGIIFPEIIDKSRISPASLLDAIIYDISEEKPKRSMEAKSRQAVRLMRNRVSSGYKQALFIEEAHLLGLPAFKALKQLFEMEQDFERLVGIILIGQTELKSLLDEGKHREHREVIRRIMAAPLEGLGDDTAAYIEMKFARIKKRTAEIFADGAMDAIKRVLTTSRGVSTAYPLSVNNFVVRAMNMAAELGEKKVTPEIINEVL